MAEEFRCFSSVGLISIPSCSRWNPQGRQGAVSPTASLKRRAVASPSGGRFSRWPLLSPSTRPLLSATSLTLHPLPLRKLRLRLPLPPPPSPLPLILTVLPPADSRTTPNHHSPGPGPLILSQVLPLQLPPLVDLFPWLPRLLDLPRLRLTIRRLPRVTLAIDGKVDAP